MGPGYFERVFSRRGVGMIGRSLSREGAGWIHSYKVRLLLQDTCYEAAIVRGSRNVGEALGSACVHVPDSKVKQAGGRIARLRVACGVVHSRRSEERRVGKEGRSRWAPDH